SGTGYRTLQPNEPATTHVTHTVELQLFPEHQRPAPPSSQTIQQIKSPGLASSQHRQMAPAA
ncbi:hypothetical protein, partial [Streptomyces sp. NPDC002758]